MFVCMCVYVYACVRVFFCSYVPRPATTKLINMIGVIVSMLIC